MGHPLRLGAHGTYELAGNVKEWVWNEDHAGGRYVLGGGWAEPSYQFPLAEVAPLDREPMYGVRCAQYATPMSEAQMAPVASPFVDWRQETPVGDEVFAVYRSLYDYDPTIPLEPSVDPERDQYAHWSVEKVSFAAAYGNERVPAWLFLPKNAHPPHQTVVFVPGFGPWLQETFPGDLTDSPYWLTRPDIDTGRLAHFGYSSGASLGPIMTAVEPRFQASVLISGGFFPWRTPPVSEAIHFVPRVTVPTLMINGRYDFYYPYEANQHPMFALLGPPPADKDHLVFEEGHTLTDRPAVMREVLDWLDRYLGPVNRP